MGEPGSQLRSRCDATTPETALGTAGNPAGSGGLAGGAEGPVVRPLALLVAGASAGLPGRCTAARSAAGTAHQDQPAGSLAPGAQQLLVDQQLLRRHGVAGAGA